MDKGFTLVEILIATSLSLFLTLGIYTTYLSNKKSFAFTHALASMQEDGRIASERLNYDVRMAGYIGCTRINTLQASAIPAKDPALIPFLDQTILLGWQDGISSSGYKLPRDIAKKALANSDILLLKEVLPDTADVDQVTDDTINFKGKVKFAEDDNLIIANCEHADLIHIKKSTKYKFLVNPQLTSADYPSSSLVQVGKVVTLFYYIADSKRKGSSGIPVMALYRVELGSTVPSELADGIQAMQISYGFINPGTHKITYVNAQQVTDWRSIVSIAVAFLLVSIDEVTDKPQSYVFSGKKYLATDRRLYREWKTTIALRERLP